MGCQQSHLTKNAIPDQEIPQKEHRANNRKKYKNQRVNPTSTSEEIHENIRKIDLPKTSAQLEFIQRAISKHFLLFKLSKQERKELAYAMEAYETEVGEYVFKQGTPASMFFIIFEGQVQIQINNAPVKIMKKGDFFGELAIIYSSPRSASVKVTEKCVFWCLSQHIFLKIQKEMVKNNYKIAKPYVSKIPIFKYLTSKQRDSISYHMNTLKYQEGEVVFKAGDAATSFYIILEGLIEIDIPGKPALQLNKGQSFGQNCLKPNKIRSGTAKCIEKTQLLAIGRQDLKFCLGGQLQEEILYHNIIKWALRRSSVFSSISLQEQEKFITSGEIVSKKDEQIITKAGENCEYLYICLQGKINEHQIGQIINQSYALEEDTNLFISSETLVKKEAGFIFMIALKNIQSKKSKDKAMQSSGGLKDPKTVNTLKPASNSNLKMDFKDLYILCKLGQGQMGKVFLVENKKTEKRYALKCVEKNLVVKHQMEKFIKCEKEILQLCDFPLIVKLNQSYKDTHFVYLLLKYIQGGDFFDFLSDLGICDNNTARFYFGCFLLILEYLHKNSIVYRDLKPENAAIDANGYLHLIDLGTAKQLTEESEAGLRTFTIIGTPHYMAPQVFQAKGYSFSVDVWSLGVILYEMLCGILPYGSYSDDPVSIYQQIEKNTLKFPKSYTDASGKQLISRLLQKHPEKRAIHDFSQIKHMDYFRNFNWKLLESQKMVAPIRPKISENKFNGRSQYLLNYLQKEKLKMDKPLASNSKWDQIF